MSSQTSHALNLFFHNVEANEHGMPSESCIISLVSSALIRLAQFVSRGKPTDDTDVQIAVTAVLAMDAEAASSRVIRRRQVKQVKTRLELLHYLGHISQQILMSIFSQNERPCG